MPGRKITVVLNPAAGRGLGQSRRPLLESVITRAIADSETDTSWSIVETTSPGAGLQIAHEAASNGADVVAAAGGDGTIGEVLNGIVGTRAKLAVIPLGTGNDFARCMGLYGNLELAVRTMVAGISHPIDIGLVAERYFLNIVGCGFDAAVAERVNRGHRTLRGTAAYIAAVAQTLISYRAPNMRITIDGVQSELRAMLCCVANSNSYGGGMLIAPNARIDDGYFDVCILREAGRLEFLLAFPRVFRGTHVTHPKFSIRRARLVTIETDRPMPVLVDGEVNLQIPVSLKIVPKAIELMCPRAEWNQWLTLT